eukprot:10520732-Lingulodinium_polyedra.AAC.1
MCMCFDQLNASELASFEFLVCRGQLAELKNNNRSLRDYAGGGIDEGHLLFGVTETRGQLMALPELEAFVAAE